jgi:hypothetical protein
VNAAPVPVTRTYPTAIGMTTGSTACTRTREQRRESFHQALNENREAWQSPNGEQTRAANQAAEAELQAWLTHHPGAVVHSHGGWAPEQWRGEVGGRSFYFRERHHDRHIEIDLRPTGQFIDVSTATTTTAEPATDNENSNKATSSPPAPSTPTATEPLPSGEHSSS